MPILTGDIKLVASSVMADVPEGGGAPTSTVIVDNVSNAVFPDISEFDRAGGRVSLRKVFASVQTPDTDTYLGANIIIAEPPVDPNVTITLFATGDSFDTRADAKNRIESYLAAGPEWPGVLLENHVVGQRALQLVQRQGVEVPEIGKTLLLSFDEGLVTQKQQYVRVTGVSSIDRQFTVLLNGSLITFDTAVVTCDISDALRYDFPGSTPQPTYSREPSKTFVRDTTVADAATYYGCTPITAPVNIGDLSADVESVFSQLVPSAQVETVMTDTGASGELATLIPTATGNVTYTSAVTFSAAQGLALGGAVTPGTLSITAGADTYTDQGGQVYRGANVVGTIDYAQGIVSFASALGSVSGSKTISFKPSFTPSTLADTTIQSVTLANRSYNYVKTLLVPPARGSMSVSYRTGGKWYTLRDNGSGVLKGFDSAFGTGTVSFVTGTVSVTLGELPDVGSAILYSWGRTLSFTNRSALIVSAGALVHTLNHSNIVPGSLTLTWPTGQTATDNGSGLLTGDATGTIDYVSGELGIIVSTLPGSGVSFSAAYNYGLIGALNATTLVNPTVNSIPGINFGICDIALAANIQPGTLRFTFPITHVVTNNDGGSVGIGIKNIEVEVRDNAIGGLVYAGSVIGTINYTTGAASFQTRQSVSVSMPTYDFQAAYGSSTSYVYQSRVNTGPSIVSYIGYVPPTWVLVAHWATAGSSSAGTSTFANTLLRYKLTPGISETVAQGSAVFSVGGVTYFDRLGTIFRDLDVATGAGIACGSMDYGTGNANLSSWVAAAANELTLIALSTVQGNTNVPDVSFRVPVAPVRPASFQVLATTSDGTIINATANGAGVISHALASGEIDYQTGVVTIRFGGLVVATTVSSESWYDPALVNLDGTIWKPAQVLAETIRYNAVAYSYLPLNADLLGIDPVRLPQDGKVAIFKPGSFAVLGHTALTVPATAVNAGTVNCGRTRLSRARLIGNNGAEIFTGFTIDLDTGILTFTDVTGYSQPVHVEHRIEDMAQVSDVQINGVLTFTRPITHVYPLGSFASTALIAGDLSARVSILFDQDSWDGVTWADSVMGAATIATYNSTLSPLVVTNAGANNERWALRFTSSTAFQIIGEHVGVIGTGSINTVTAPINPATSQPYFTVPALGWGVGWSVGNVLRFNTVGTEFPYYIARTVQQGPEAAQDYSFSMITRGDVDRP